MRIKLGLSRFTKKGNLYNMYTLGSFIPKFYISLNTAYRVVIIGWIAITWADEYPRDILIEWNI